MNQVVLFIGEHDFLIDHAQKLLLEHFCSQKNCKKCTTCAHILARQYYNLWWLVPDKQTYTVAQLEPIATISSFQRAESDRFYFVIERADALSPSSANQLLKILEEPPRGYYFILLGERLDMILPTIVSRCVVQNIRTNFTEIDSLINVFLQSANPVLFIKEWEKRKITEYETRNLLDQLLIVIKKNYEQAVRENNYSLLQRSEKQLSSLEQAFQLLPMPGSAKLFWRNLYLQLHSS
jgi:DNA polymerase III subunit delta'